MTPKEKAKELVDRYRNELSWIESDHRVDLYRDAKQCAIICVGEILKVQVFKDGYWAKVKAEIEAM